MTKDQKLDGLLVTDGDTITFSSESITIDIRSIACKSLPVTERLEFVRAYTRNLSVALETMNTASLETTTVHNFLEKRPQPPHLPLPRFVNAYSKDSLNLYWGLGSTKGFSFLNKRKISELFNSKADLDNKYRSDLLAKRKFTLAAYRLPKNRGVILSGEGVVELCTDPDVLAVLCNKLGMSCSRVFFQALGQLVVWMSDASNKSCLSWSTIETFYSYFYKPSKNDIIIANSHLGTAVKLSKKKIPFNVTVKFKTTSKQMIDCIKPQRIYGIGNNPPAND